MQGVVKCQNSSLKPSMSVGVTSRHNRSKSDTCNRIREGHLDAFPVVASRRVKLKDMELVKGGTVEPKKEQSPKKDLQISLKQEILHLEKRLQDQLAERQALEKALGYRSSSQYSLNENSIAQPAQELIKEIAVLELEVVYLEQYLLSLYRKTFDSPSSVSSPTTGKDRLKSPSFTQQGISEEVSRLEITSNKEKLAIRSSRLQLPQESLNNPLRTPNSIKDTEKLSKPGIDRSQSSLAQHSAFSTSTSPHTENLAKAVRACHSQPLSFHESMQKNVTNVVSLAEHLGTRISDHIPETPNKLSEDMIKCMSAIYYKLADPPRMHNGLSSSPISSSSSINAFSPQYQYDTWSPQCRKDSSFDSRLDNPFHVEGLKEFSGPYSTMVEVPFIYTDSQRMSDVDHMLQNYRSLVCRLEVVDPTKMRHEEKLAFWINIHNALVMHTFLVYGIPRNYLKRVSLLLKAAYNVGGHTISAEMIQTSILGCRMPRPSQWFRIFFSSRTKFKAGDNRQAYIVERNEPLLHFALCSGSHSDAAVRLYTPKRLFHELEAAKEEYIRATFGVRKGHKILMSKIVESFAKDSGLCPIGVMEMIQKSMPDTLQKTIQRCQQQQQGCPRKTIEWVPHNFAFRYLLSKELVIK